MIKIALSFILFATFLLTPSGQGFPKTYKYVDEKGIAHFTNIPSDPRYEPVSGKRNPKGNKQESLKPKQPLPASPKPSGRGPS